MTPNNETQEWHLTRPCWSKRQRWQRRQPGGCGGVPRTVAVPRDLSQTCPPVDHTQLQVYYGGSWGWGGGGGAKRVECCLWLCWLLVEVNYSFLTLWGRGGLKGLNSSSLVEAIAWNFIRYASPIWRLKHNHLKKTIIKSLSTTGFPFHRSHSSQTFRNDNRAATLTLFVR